MADNAGLKCPHGSYRHHCDRPVTKLALSNVETYEKLATDPEFRKRTNVDPTSTAVNALHCNVHAAAKARTTLYRTPERFILIADIEPGSIAEAMLKAVRREYERQEDNLKAERAARVADAEKRAAARTTRLWAEHDAEPDYEVAYVEDPRFWGEGVVDRKYLAYTPDVPAERRDTAGSFAALTVEISDRDTDIPAYVTTRSSSNLTPKAARALATMLMAAAEKAEATTTQRKKARA